MTRRPNRALQIAGRSCVIVGLVVLAALGWELWGTGLVTDRAQQDASDTLTVQWQVPPAPDPPALGEPITRIRIPAVDVDQVVLEGVGDAQLADGPGHYPASARPGQEGNVGIAAHRVTHGAPFGRLDELRPCDAVVLEGRAQAWTYRVLPVAGQPNPCNLPAGIPGQQIVDPERGDVLRPSADRKLLTLTTCHPKYSARQRLIIHAELIEEPPMTTPATS